MTSEQFLAFIVNQQNFYEEADRLSKNDMALNLECARMSQIIAALVAEYGGKISAENWASVSVSHDKFFPHGLAASKEGVVITVKLSEEAPA